MSATRASTMPVSDPKASVDIINAELFRALGHPVRVRVLELLRTHQEMSVRDLQATLQIESRGASQHLSAMRRQGLLATRRQGTSVFYRVRDPRAFQLLVLARQILTSHVQYNQTLLDGLNDAQHMRRESAQRARR
jgi:DNA-binding transcriptional ArsR family regulator